HFDFGATLRAVAGEPGAFPFLSAGDVAVVLRSLRTGALLENEHFIIARRLLQGRLEGSPLEEGGLLLLNGLPRHEGQARDLEESVDVAGVVRLEASAATVRERIRLDAGGDRGGRTDDSVDAVSKKLSIFRSRTESLIEHYRRCGARILTLEVRTRDTAEGMFRRLEAWWSAPGGPSE
ncbi:MAG: nucleoside monophosphate kinase, partial [Planctomycetota bacterium]